MSSKRRVCGPKPKQLTAIAALLEGKTQGEAAKAAGVDPNTIHRWLKSDSTFIATYNGQLREIRRLTRDRLMALAGDAVKTLAEVARSGDPDSTPSRVRAAVSILRFIGMGQPDPIGPDSKHVVQAKLTREETAAGVDLTISVLAQNIKMMASRLLMDPDAPGRQMQAAADIIFDSTAADAMAELKPLKTEIDATEDDLMKARAFEPGLKEIIPQDRQEAWDKANQPARKPRPQTRHAKRMAERRAQDAARNMGPPPSVFHPQPEPEAPDAGYDEPEGPEECWEDEEY